jgi:aspartyl-tRNA(Asn)/glutamyl-tRNA(Gln) amidotransferase subunit B
LESNAGEAAFENCATRVERGYVEYEPVVGLEVHAELATQSKMFCGCAVVDSITAEPNRYTCPVCLGLPGALPVVNRKAVEMGLRVALALHCNVSSISLFARKNYFYPDLPKGYQISQYELPLATKGALEIRAGGVTKTIAVTRVHLEEDTGKLSHDESSARSWVDLNRAGIPLLEIVSEPEMHSVEDVKGYATALHRLVRYLGVNSGDMEKGVIRFEANISLRPVGDTKLGTRVEIKNLNSFRALVRSMEYEVERQAKLLRRGETIAQETLGWDEAAGRTYSQRSKEEAHDYRYFPDPDLPPLEVSEEWLARVRKTQPELPDKRQERFQSQYGLTGYDAEILVEEKAVADYFEQTVRESGAPAKPVAAWLTGDLFGALRSRGLPMPGASAADPIPPDRFGGLVRMVTEGKINGPTAKAILDEMLTSGRAAEDLVAERGLEQIGDADTLRVAVRLVLKENPEQVLSYKNGKTTVLQWMLGRVMKSSGGRANPQILRALLEEELGRLP